MPLTVSLMLSRISQQRIEHGRYLRFRYCRLTSETALLHSADVYGRTGRNAGVCGARRLDTRDFGDPRGLVIVGDAVGIGGGALEGVELLAGNMTLPREPAATSFRSKGIKPPIATRIRVCVCCKRVFFRCPESWPSDEEGLLTQLATSSSDLRPIVVRNLRPSRLFAVQVDSVG